MKVFLSWSGEESQAVARVFRKWLPHAMKFTDPFMSDEDMKKGAPWSEALRNQLRDSLVGIFFVTEENRGAEWLAFEAGALLLNGMGPGHVCPFLFNVDPSEMKGPLREFHATTNRRADIKRLVDTLNERADESDRLPDDTLEGAFDRWYPDLEKELNQLAGTRSTVGAAFSKRADPDDEGNQSRPTADTSSNDRTHVVSPANRFVRLKELERLLPRFRHKYILLYLAIDLFRHDLPWIYDAGIHLVGTLRPRSDRDEVDSVASAFMELVEATFENRTMTEIYSTEHEHRAVGILRQIVNAIIESSDYRNPSICRRQRITSV